MLLHGTTFNNVCECSRLPSMTNLLAANLWVCVSAEDTDAMKTSAQMNGFDARHLESAVMGFWQAQPAFPKPMYVARCDLRHSAPDLPKFFGPRLA